jgi:phosphatidylinositol-3-phosphatase
MKFATFLLSASLAVAAAGPASADFGHHDHGFYGPQIPRLDHVFLIVMENHHYDQVIGNTDAPFINSYAQSANLAANYYGVGHPSLTNYLEIVGGSNFGVENDNSPDWHNHSCKPNIVTHSPSYEGAPNVCPIAGFGLDAATPAVDDFNEGAPPYAPLYNDPLDAAPTVAMTIADQLGHAGKTWKSYQENLPPYGADNVDYSDGLLSEVGAQFAHLPKLYAVKHNPFVYFANIQEHDLDHVVGFSELYQDLDRGHVPNLAFIAPNQCHDQHGRGSTEVGSNCVYDPDPSTSDLNADLTAQADAALQNLVTAIKSSHAWREGQNAIVVVWDENDYSGKPNQVVTIVDTNYGVKGVTSTVKYNHFALLKTLEAGFGLGYLNHAGDKNVPLMSDLFGR